VLFTSCKKTRRKKSEKHLKDITNSNSTNLLLSSLICPKAIIKYGDIGIFVLEDRIHKDIQV